MRILTITGCLPNQKKSAAKIQAEECLVHIMEGREAIQISLTIQVKKNFIVKRRNIQDALAMPSVAEIDFDP
ncbi:prevent-host-death protein [Pantoea rodasii]|uniref:Prevent-host-death protein n=1 Tax=Pantoea rodasii TaxID=1076549 RepID=A0A2M9W8R8_9GAMM|nr:prevent-host-death protein [Pantoea rodasii]ORM63653.1 hypothetical protein HA45_13650 [Pantoea rodasii]PJZ03922.1 prevent-host-death protein [Pantoea rodasii]